MENKTTIVIVNDFDYIQGGASKVAIDTAILLHENKYNVIFFSATHKDNDYKFKQVCTNQNECLKDGIKGALRGLKNNKVEKEFSKLLDSLDKNNTIIHIHGWTKSLSSIIFKVAYKKNFKTVLTMHDYFTACPNGGFYNYKKNQICELNPMSFKCKKCNCDSRNYLFKIYRIIRQKIQNKNMKYLNNYIYISEFSYNVLKKYNKGNFYKVYNPIPIKKSDRTNVEKNNYYVYIGRISKEKGVDKFCTALNKLKLKGIVVGDGSEKEALENEYSNVEFVGWKNSLEVQEYMKNAKALIFPSNWYEGSPLTIMEALSNGLPCIVPEKCAASDYINEDNGLIFDGTVDSLVDKIEKYEKMNIKKISENAYNNYWKEPFDNKRYLKELKKVYDKIIGD